MRRIPLVFAAFVLFNVGATSAQTGHTVALSWTQSTGSGLTADKVYRSTTSGSQGTAIYTSTVPVITYVDKGPLTDGVTYYYCVAAVSGKSESACSKQVGVAIPAAPPTPTAISVTVN